MQWMVGSFDDSRLYAHNMTDATFSFFCWRERNRFRRSANTGAGRRGLMLRNPRSTPPLQAFRFLKYLPVTSFPRGQQTWCFEIMNTYYQNKRLRLFWSFKELGLNASRFVFVCFLMSDEASRRHARNLAGELHPFEQGLAASPLDLTNFRSYE